MLCHVVPTCTTLFLVLEPRTILYDCWQQGWERETEVTLWKKILFHQQKLEDAATDSS